MSGYWQAINYVRVKWLNLPEVGYEKNPLVSHVKLVKDGLMKPPFGYVCPSVNGGMANKESHGQLMANGGKATVATHGPQDMKSLST